MLEWKRYSDNDDYWHIWLSEDYQLAVYKEGNYWALNLPRGSHAPWTYEGNLRVQGRFTDYDSEEELFADLLAIAQEYCHD